MSFSKILYPLLSTGSTQEDRKTFGHDLKIVDWDVKQQHKQTEALGTIFCPHILPPKPLLQISLLKSGIVTEKGTFLNTVIILLFLN